MNYFFYPPLISSIFVIFLGIFVFVKNPKEKINFTFFLHTIAIAIWLFGTFMMFFKSYSQEVAIFWDRFVYIGVVFIPAFMYHFSLALTKKKNNFLLYLSYALSFFFLLLSRSDYFIKDLFYYKWGVHSKAQIIHHIFLVYFFVYMLIWFGSVYAYYRKKEQGIEKQKIKYSFIAFLFLFILGPLAYLPAYEISLYPFLYFSGLIFTIILAYAILRYRLFSIRIILNNTLIYIITSISAAIIIYLVFLLSEDFFYNYPYLSALFSIFIFSIIFNPLNKLSKKISTRVFYNGYNPYDNINEIIFKLKKSTDIKDMLDNMSSIFKKTLGITKLDLILLLDDEGYRFESINKKDYEKPIIHKLISFFKLCKIALIKDEISRLPSRKNSNPIFKNEQIEIFKKTNSHLVAPFYSGETLIAILIVGNREKSRTYNREDLEFLEKIIKGISDLIINLKIQHILNSYAKDKIISNK